MQKTKYMSLKDFNRPTNTVKNLSDPLPKSNYEINTASPVIPRKRTIREIAIEIFADWKKVSPHALPYLEAMMTVEKPSDMYGAETAKGIVQYFLSNAEGWRGEGARRMKTELRELINDRDD